PSCGDEAAMAMPRAGWDSVARVGPGQHCHAVDIAGEDIAHTLQCDHRIRLESNVGGVSENRLAGLSAIRVVRGCGRVGLADEAASTVGYIFVSNDPDERDQLAGTRIGRRSSNVHAEKGQIGCGAGLGW